MRQWVWPWICGPYMSGHGYLSHMQNMIPYILYIEEVCWMACLKQLIWPCKSKYCASIFNDIRALVQNNPSLSNRNGLVQSMHEQLYVQYHVVGYNSWVFIFANFTNLEPLTKLFQNVLGNKNVLLTRFIITWMSKILWLWASLIWLLIFDIWKCE